MTTVNQPSSMPTRKLTAAITTASIAAIIKAQIIHMWPHLAEPLIWEPLPIIVGGVVGWFVKDKPNVQVDWSQDQRGV
jgi:hypothetical protein